MEHAKVIEMLGGTCAVARLASVKPPSVSEWVANNRIPTSKLILLANQIEAMGICSRADLLPHGVLEMIWPELVSPASPTEGPLPSPEQSVGGVSFGGANDITKV